jgi:predicted nucleic acid-binding Zn ribbon protein
MEKTENRELTRGEKAAIRKLVTAFCANFDREYGCLPLGCECYMFGKCWTGAYCRYFRNAVLPIDPVLEATLMGREKPADDICAVCGDSFYPEGRQKYCSKKCSDTGSRHKSRERMRKKRQTE